jgi:hypothetical protein
MMAKGSSTAERIDRAVDHLLAGAPPGTSAATAGVADDDRGVVEVAGALRAALAIPPIGPRFEARLGARLAGTLTGRDPVAWALRHPGRLIVTGAVGSAVGVGVTAYAVWRSGRRSSGAAHRLLHR